MGQSWIQEDACRILPSSEIDWGLLLVVFFKLRRETSMSQNWPKGQSMAIDEAAGLSEAAVRGAPGGRRRMRHPHRVHQVRARPKLHEPARSYLGGSVLLRQLRI